MIKRVFKFVVKIQSEDVKIHNNRIPSGINLLFSILFELYVKIFIYIMNKLIKWYVVGLLGTRTPKIIN